jgi:cation transport ATPase
MTKKNDKRLCWNCEGNVSHHLAQCPYCGVDVTQPVAKDENTIFKGYGSPFQSAPKQEIPQPPYAKAQSQEFAVTEEEWNSTVNAEKEAAKEESSVSKKELMALLLLLPGVVFSLFGLALCFFSSDGILTLQWNKNVAYFYFLGAAPLLYLGWRAFRN